MASAQPRVGARLLERSHQQAGLSPQLLDGGRQLDVPAAARIVVDCRRQDVKNARREHVLAKHRQHLRGGQARHEEHLLRKGDCWLFHH